MASQVRPSCTTSCGPRISAGFPCVPSTMAPKLPSVRLVRTVQLPYKVYAIFQCIPSRSFRPGTRHPWLRSLRLHCSAGAQPVSVQQLLDQSPTGGYDPLGFSGGRCLRFVPGDFLNAIDRRCRASRKMACGWAFFGHVKVPNTTVDAMETHGSVNSLPQVPILDPLHFAKPLPLPIVLAPFVQSETQAVGDVSAGRQQRHARRLVQGFQSTDDSQQFQTAGVALRFVIGRFQHRFAINALQHEPPPANRIRRGQRSAITRGTRFGK